MNRKLQFGLIIVMLCYMFSVLSMADFVDNFDRADSSEVGNGWTQTGDDLFNVSISSEELSWGPRGNGNGRRTASLSHTFDQANLISLDMKTPVVHSSSDTTLEFKITDDSGTNASILLTQTVTDSWQTVRIYLNGLEQIASGVSDNTVYHNYSFEISDTGQLSVIFGSTLQWQSSEGVMGNAVSTTITASRWWEYCQFNADNFSATMVIPEPTTMALLISGCGMCILSKRRRK